MSVSKRLIIWTVLTSFSFTNVQGTWKDFADVVKISISQCKQCDSFSHKMVAIGAPSNNNVIQLTIPSTSYFFVVQAHNYFDTLGLSYAAKPTASDIVYGTNVGLNQLTHASANHTFYLFNNFTSPRNVLFAVTSYSKSAPMPGGCNMEFNTKTAPYIKVQYNEAVITVDVQSASVSRQLCEAQGNITLDFYQIFIFPTETENMTDIIKMLTVDSIRHNAHKVIRPEGNPELRRYFNNYKGFGAVYVVIASFGDKSSAYVPASTFGCNMQSGKTSCFMPEEQTVWLTMDISSAISFILLLFPCTSHIVPFFHWGYYSVCAAMALLGLPVWAFIYYVIGIAVVFALILGGITMYLNCVLIVLRLYAAHILTAVIYFGTATGDSEMCQTVWYFWILYCALMLAMMIPVLDRIAQYVNVSFHIALMLDALLGNGRMMYINIDAVRRASVTNYYLVSLFAPNTLLPVIGGIIVIAIGFLIIKFCCCRNSPGLVLSEVTPLLG